MTLPKERGAMSELWIFFFCGAFGISFVGLMLLRRHAPWIKHTHKMDLARRSQRALYNSEHDPR